MNTLSDTDEGRARPSVWPVYVAAVVILVVGLGLLYPVVDYLSFMVVSEGSLGNFETSYLMPVLLYSSIGLFGCVTALGLVLLRSWGWWCAAVWAGIFAAGLVYLGLGCLTSPGLLAIGGGAALLFFIVFVAPLGLVAIVQLIRLLETRRQLFFSTKPEGEE